MHTIELDDCIAWQITAGYFHILYISNTAQAIKIQAQMFCLTHRHVHVTNRVSPREIGALHRLDITLLTETRPRPIYYLCQVSRIRLTSRIVRRFVRRNQRGLFTPYSSSRYDKNSDFPTASRQFIIDCMGGPRGSPCRKRVMSIKSLRGLTRRVGLEFDRGSCSAGYQTFFVASGNVSGTLQWRYSTGHASILSTQLGSWAYIPVATV